VDADHFGIGTLGDTIGAGTGIQSHTAQLRNLSSEEKHVQSGWLPSHSVSLAVGAGFSAGFLGYMYARIIQEIGVPPVV